MTNRPFLWTTPSHGLVHRAGRWYAAADRTLGDAWGLLAPVRREGGRWAIAAAPDTPFQLSRIMVDDLRELPCASADGEAERFCCLLRYDLPADRPGATFNDAIAPELPRSERAPVVSGPPHPSTTGAQLQAALQNLWRLQGDALERQFVRPPRPAPNAPLRFVFASCQYPAGMLDRLPALRTYQLLAGHFAEGELPTRMLLLGDQVYTDATYGLLDPARLDDRYRLPYEQLHGADGPLAQLPHDFRSILRMTPDDHEIVDNWEPWRPGATGERHRRGLKAYWRYQRGENDPRGQDVWIKECATPGEDCRWHLFMADTRTSRDHRSEDTLHRASILGARQAQELADWLVAMPNEDLKIVTSAAMLLPRTKVHLDTPLRLDNWQGYPASVHALLALVCERELRNLVFLSGDLHLACSAQVTVTDSRSGRTAAFESHHAPALYAPYPFANETKWNLLTEDRFEFRWPTRDGGMTTYEVTVNAQVPGTSAGFGLLEARQEAGAWKLETRFVSAGDQEIRTPCSAAM